MGNGFMESMLPRTKSIFEKLSSGKIVTEERRSGKTTALLMKMASLGGGTLVCANESMAEFARGYAGELLCGKTGFEPLVISAKTGFYRGKQGPFFLDEVLFFPGIVIQEISCDNSSLDFYAVSSIPAFGVSFPLRGTTVL